MDIKNVKIRNVSKKEIFNLVKAAIEEKAVLQETSYNRVREHVEEGNPFVIISSDRHERSGQENKQIYQQMKQDFKVAGFPFTEMKGGYRETTEIETDPTSGEKLEAELEEPRHVIENSLLITTHERPDVESEENTAEKLFKVATEIAFKYDQEAFIFGEGATTTSGKQIKIVRAYDKNGNQINESWAGPWTNMEIVSRDSDFWSRVKGKHFQLKERKKTSQPKSWVEAMMKSKKGLTW